MTGTCYYTTAHSEAIERFADQLYARYTFHCVLGLEMGELYELIDRLAQSWRDIDITCFNGYCSIDY